MYRPIAISLLCGSGTCQPSDCCAQEYPRVELVEAEKRGKGGAHSFLTCVSIDDGHNGRPEEQARRLMIRRRGAHEPRPRAALKVRQE